MPRTVQPELLDSLPPHHPDALHNRRDLQLTNRIMGNHRWFIKTLPPLVRPGERVLEIGAGTGELAHALEARGIAVDGVDLWPRPETWPPARRWHQGDVRTFTGLPDYPVVIGNLIFHQFNDDELARLGAQLLNARLVLASEPSRQRWSQILYRSAGPFFGVSHVSLHDAHVSIAAGFRGGELPRALGLLSPVWQTHARRALIGAYRMVAIRRT